LPAIAEIPATVEKRKTFTETKALDDISRSSGWPSAKVERLDQLDSGEEIADFKGRGFWGVGAVGAVVTDAGAEIAADAAWRGFFRVGGAHGVAPFKDGAIGFEHQREDFAGGHEVGEFAEEGAGFVDGVEAARFFFGQAHGLDGNDAEASFVDARQDFALLACFYGVRFDDCECAFE